MLFSTASFAAKELPHKPLRPTGRQTYTFHLEDRTTHVSLKNKECAAYFQKLINMIEKLKDDNLILGEKTDDGLLKKRREYGESCIFNIFFYIRQSKIFKKSLKLNTNKNPLRKLFISFEIEKYRNEINSAKNMIVGVKLMDTDTMTNTIKMIRSGKISVEIV